ncbi:hypothetical protein C8Q74DRAFT_1221353 [Fomes fomentarius]|nr:hypothetical protein C8Q74DRAFT_1221353 [Fomes fomentarius]
MATVDGETTQKGEGDACTAYCPLAAERTGSEEQDKQTTDLGAPPPRSPTSTPTFILNCASEGPRCAWYSLRDRLVAFELELESVFTIHAWPVRSSVGKHFGWLGKHYGVVRETQECIDLENLSSAGSPCWIGRVRLRPPEDVGSGTDRDWIIRVIGHRRAEAERTAHEARAAQTASKQTGSLTKAQNTGRRTQNAENRIKDADNGRQDTGTNAAGAVHDIGMRHDIPQLIMSSSRAEFRFASAIGCIPMVVEAARRISGRLEDIEHSVSLGGLNVEVWPRVETAERRTQNAGHRTRPLSAGPGEITHSQTGDRQAKRAQVYGYGYGMIEIRGRRDEKRSKLAGMRARVRGTTSLNETRKISQAGSATHIHLSIVPCEVRHWVARVARERREYAQADAVGGRTGAAGIPDLDEWPRIGVGWNEKGKTAAGRVLVRFTRPETKMDNEAVGSWVDVYYGGRRTTSDENERGARGRKRRKPGKSGNEEFFIFVFFDQPTRMYTKGKLNVRDEIAKALEGDNAGRPKARQSTVGERKTKNWERKVAGSTQSKGALRRCREQRRKRWGAIGGGGRWIEAGLPSGEKAG